MQTATPVLTIRRLRTRVPGGDCLATRRRWERALAAADPVPPDLAEDGLLVLRHVAWRAGRRSLSDLRSFLAEARDRAARPAECAPAANADAVWFRDEGELLFCLARDWLAGTLDGRWWWTALGLSAAEGALRRWLVLPRAVPAAIERLAREGLAVNFLETLEPPAVATLACAVADAFALPALRVSTEASPDEPPGDEPALPAGVVALTGEPPPRLPRVAQTLWLASLLLVRRPAIAQSALGAGAFEDCLVPPVADDGSRGTGTVATTASTPTLMDESPAPGKAGAQPAAAVEWGASGPSRLLGERVIEEGPELSMAENDAVPALQVSVSSEAGIPAQWPQVRLQQTSGEADPALPAPRHVPRQVVSERPPRVGAGASELTARTALGGMFYLLNVALDLGIYSDFTRPRGPNLALSPFDWLGLLGTHWFGQEFETDPLAVTLVRLAGRQPDTPPAWPERTREPESWLRAEAGRIHERLVAGLPEAFARGLPGCVCRHDAEVMVKPQRVEVRFALVEHPIELRLSGLDRDPGWLPAAGHTILFRYD